MCLDSMEHSLLFVKAQLIVVPMMFILNNGFGIQTNSRECAPYVVQNCRVPLCAVLAFTTTETPVVMSQHLRLNEIIQR